MDSEAALNGGVGVVTGGASGIGRGLAEAMIARGMTVVIADIDEAGLAETARQIGAHAQRVDVSDESSVRQLACWTVKTLGVPRVLCNNAGVGPAALVSDTSLQEWRWMLDVNLMGVIHGVHHFLPAMRKQDKAFIINTASLSGLVGMPTRGAYAVAKFGVVALTEVLSKELAGQSPGITASVICPGPVRTNIGSGSRHRPESVGVGGLSDFELEDNVVLSGRTIRYLTGREVAELALAGALRGDLYIQTHPEFARPVLDRNRMIAASFAAVPEA